MIKILHVISKIHQGSGIASVIMNYYRNIDRNKIQFDFLVSSTEGGEEYISEIKRYGGEIYYLPKLKLTNFNNFIKEMDSFFYQNGNQYTAIHSHFYQLDGILFPIAKKYGVKECISHSHNTKFSDYKVRAIRNYLMSRPLKKYSTKWMACSKKAGKLLFGKSFFNSPKSKILNNAIDCKRYIYNEEIRENKRKEFGLENKFVVGHVGRFSPQKNHKFLINVFNKIKKNNNNAVLVLVGTGSLMKSVQDQVKKYNLENDVLFLGQRHDVHHLLQMFDVLIFPSLFEGLGIALVEAQAADLPCVYSDVIPDEVNILESNEVLSLNESYDVWADAALKYQNKKRSSSAVKEIKKAGYCIENEAKNLLQFYMNIAYEE
ncbi:glycosyltransferase family 1 protein [Caldibacillus thermoamylovorans]|uniref:glycosyltransferase family 1 protein n=1 Tax=Caldibacillus thermoamylovorans TaxID=35841 RepID=UPI0005A48D34|nr:glycosyltransferase family 1 protein [Caldibacillus thermoamylovorans]